MLDIVRNDIVYSVPEAIKLLDNDPEAKIIAGGTDVIIKIRAGKLPCAKLVSIGMLRELRGVSMEGDGTIKIGPLTTFHELESDALLTKHIPVLSGAAGTVGGPQIRAVGTIGGNICNGATSADTASTLFTLNAKLQITSFASVEEKDIEDFYLGAGKVALPQGALLTAIRIRKKDYDGYRGYYVKYAQRNAMDISTLGCAVQLKLDSRGNRIGDIRIAFGVAAPVPLRAKNTEMMLKGLSLTDAIEKGPELLRAEIHPRDSRRASREFRIHIAGEIFKQSLTQAWKEVLSAC